MLRRASACRTSGSSAHTVFPIVRGDAGPPRFGPDIPVPLEVASRVRRRLAGPAGPLAGDPDDSGRGDRQHHRCHARTSTAVWVPAIAFKAATRSVWGFGGDRKSPLVSA